MTTNNKSSVDLEERFIKKFSPTIMVSMLNSSSHFRNIISKELDDQLSELAHDAKKMGPKSSVIVSFNTDEVNETIFAGPPDRRLHRTLYRQSRFFNAIKTMSLTFAPKGPPTIMLHEEEQPLRTAIATLPSELDTFNQYVLLHLLPYFKKQWKIHLEDDSYKRTHKILEEVVMDKIGGLREQEQESEA